MRPRTDLSDRLRRSLPFFSLKWIERGFTLVELLIAMLITGIVASAAITVFFVFIFHFEQTDELTTAQQNGEMVLTILRNPVLHAGLGMPNESPDFNPTDVTVDSVQGWDLDSDLRLGGPVELVGGGSILRVLYGVPSSLIVESSCDITAGASNDLDLSDTPDTDIFKLGKTSKGFLLLPTGPTPFKILHEDDDTLTIENISNSAAAIPQYVDVYFFRGLEAKVISGNFMTEDLSLQGATTRVENIAAIFFEHTDTLLKTWVVAAGPKKHDEPIYEDWIAFKDAFPDYGGPEFDDFNSDWKYHRLRVLSESWRVRN